MTCKSGRTLGGLHRQKYSLSFWYLSFQRKHIYKWEHHFMSKLWVLQEYNESVLVVSLFPVRLCMWKGKKKHWLSKLCTDQEYSRKFRDRRWSSNKPAVLFSRQILTSGVNSLGILTIIQFRTTDPAKYNRIFSKYSFIIIPCAVNTEQCESEVKC